jgi:hypothetical protein
VTDVQTERPDRRRAGQDRRKNPRNGRRATDPHIAWKWRRVAWLFAAYAAYVSVRSLPQTLQRLFGRRVSE